MATETNHTVEVYDNATGEHYTRPANAEELAFYEQLEAEALQPTEPPTEPTDETPSAA
jgi:hypothetical protein